MEKELIKLFRRMGVSNEALPDSAKLEKIEQFVKEQGGSLNIIKQDDFKALQKKLSKKDEKLKKLEKEIEKSDQKNKDDKDIKIDRLSETVKELTGQIEELNKERETEKLKKEYPDILPSVLLGKSDEEKEKIAREQREINKQTYGDLPSAHEQKFSDISEIEEEIERVKKDKTIDTEQKMIKIGELKDKKAEF